MRRRFGKYRAQVVDRSDPSGQGRLQVRTPVLPGRASTAWAVACVPPGYAALPEVGDTVGIEFEEGDVRHPVWVGSTWPGSNAPISIDLTGVRIQATAELELKGPRVKVVAPILEADGMITGTTLVA